VNGHCYGACASAGDCDDGVFCNGAETCVDNDCTAGDEPCDAGFDCVEDSETCEEAPPICGSGFGCTTSSPLMGLTLLALFCLRGTYRRVRPVGRARTSARTSARTRARRRNS
jgi:hypothetical protein